MSGAGELVWNAGDVAVVTDSVAQVPAETAHVLKISVVPSVVVMQGRQYRDGVDLDPQSLYREMREEGVLPQTTAPPVGYFYEAFSSCLQGGAGAVLYVGLTSRLSATFSAAEAAAHILKEEQPTSIIRLYDTRTATMAQGFIAIEAARMANQGADLQQVFSRALEVRERVGLYVSLETLDYLARGGRIGRAAYMLGSRLHILPVLTIDDEGCVAPIARVRGAHMATARIVDMVLPVLQDCHRVHIAIMHAGVPEKADEMERLVREKIDPYEIIRTDFTPVMGAHTGPGVIGLAYYYD